MMSIMISLFCLFSVIAQAAPPIPASVTEYDSLLKKAEKDGSVEAAYKKGKEALGDLSGSLEHDESEIDAQWLSLVRKKMDGFAINPNTESTLGYAKHDFFLALARKNKQLSEAAFFELSSKTESAGWPVYLEQQTDLGGCTKYNGTLSKLYDEWNNFIKKNPKTFTEASKHTLQAIKDELSENVCACTKSLKPVLEELQTFVKAHPDDKFSLVVKERTEKLKNKKAEIRLGCIGGS